MRYLFVNLLLLGDVINSAHVAAALLKWKKQTRIDLLVFSSNRDLANIMTPFTNIYCLDRNKLFHNISNEKTSLVNKYLLIQKSLAEVTSESYDWIINLTHNKLSAVVTSLMNASNIMGAYLNEDRILSCEAESSWFKYFNDFVTSDIYNSFQYIDVYKKAMQIPSSIYGKLIVKASTEKFHDLFNGDKYFIIKPTTSEIKKNWPLLSYAEMARKLCSALGCRVLALGPRQESDLLDHVTRQIGEAAKWGIFSFQELVSILNGAEFIVGGDTGILHLAASMGKRTITLSMGPGTFYKSTPYGNGNIILYPSSICYPCPHLTPCPRNHRCHSHIHPQDVVDAVTKNYVTSSSCGALITSFDDAGFLTYHSINPSYQSQFFNTIMRVRPIIRNYLDTHGSVQDYQFDELIALVENCKKQRNQDWNIRPLRTHHISSRDHILGA